MSSMKKESKETQSAVTVYNNFLRVNVPKEAVLEKQYVWLEDKNEAFVRVELAKEDGDRVEVIEENGVTGTYTKSQIHDYNPPKFDGIEDLGNLSFLNEASVLHNLRLRHAEKRIHTYSGLFLVVINPYQRFPIYTPSIINMYKGKRRIEIAPHCFTVADQSFRNMCDERQNQSILITGESGAGKTENTKKVIIYLTNVAVGGATAAKKSGGLEDQILQANPLLEAFGNAKTLRNDNSSRFGKFIELQFTSRFSIAGASIDHYLLELSRVVWQSELERNYHIFYQIFAGYPKDKLAELKLTKPEDFHYTNQSGCTTVDTMDDAEEWEATKEAMDIMGILTVDQENVMLLIAAILHIGNLTFKGDRSGEKATVSNQEALENAAALLQVPAEDLAMAVTKQKIMVAGKKIVKERNADNSAFARDAMVKIVYDQLFAWIVARINRTIDHQENMRHFIGVLDIAGFEIFKHNSLEQILINYTNERLQQFFNSHMFKLEQEEYAREKIQWEFEDFGMDLQPTIEMLEKKGGILDTLDEQCVFPKATDLSYIEKLHAAFGDGKHEKYVKPRIGHEEHFSVCHYAGDVEYTVSSWLTKNMNPLTDDITDLLDDSGNPFVHTLFEGMSQGNERHGKSKKKVITVGSMHREQLNKLMATLSATHPHFIRCIKPNPNKSADEYVNLEVLEQLRCNGVMEGIRIAKKGYPNRMLYGEFRKRFNLLAPEGLEFSLDIREACGQIIENLDFANALYGLSSDDQVMGNDWYQLGRTKAFFRAGKLALLEQMRDATLSKSAVKLQAMGRGFLVRNEEKRAARQAAGAAVLQKNVRIFLGDTNNMWHQLYKKLRPLLKPNRKAELEEEQRAELKQLRQERDMLLSERDDLLTRIAVLEQERDDTNHRLAENEDSQNMLERQIAQARHDLEENLRFDKEAEEAIGQLTRRLEEQQGALAKKEAEAFDGDEKGQALARERSDLLARVDMESGERQRAESQQSKLEEGISTTKERLEEEQRQRQSIEKQKRTLEGDHASAAEELASVTAQRRKVENDLSVVRGEIDDAHAEMDDLDRQRRKFDSEVSQLTSKLHNKDVDKDNTDQSVQNMKDQIIQLEADKETIADDSKRNLAKTKTQIQEEHDAEAADAEEAAKKAKKNSAKKLAELQEELDAAEAKHQQLTEERAALELKLKRAIEDQAAAAAAAAASAEMEEVKARRMELEAALEEEVAKEKKFSREAKMLKSEKEDVEEDLASMAAKFEKKIAKHDANNERYVKKLEEESAAHEKLKGEHADLTAQVEAMEQQIKDNQAKLLEAEESKRKVAEELADELEEQKNVRASGSKLAKEGMRDKHRDLMDLHEELEDTRALRYEHEDNVLESKVYAQELDVELATAKRESHIADRNVETLEAEVEKWKAKLEEARERWAAELQDTRDSLTEEITRSERAAEAAIVSEFKAQFSHNSVSRQITAATAMLRPAPSSRRSKA